MGGDLDNNVFSVFGIRNRKMTRKEAIEILKKHYMWTGEPSEIVDV